MARITDTAHRVELTSCMNEVGGRRKQPHITATTTSHSRQKICGDAILTSCYVPCIPVVRRQNTAVNSKDHWHCTTLLGYVVQSGAHLLHEVGGRRKQQHITPQLHQNLARRYVMMMYDIYICNASCYVPSIPSSEETNTTVIGRDPWHCTHH